MMVFPFDQTAFQIYNFGVRPKLLLESVESMAAFVLILPTARYGPGSSSWTNIVDVDADDDDDDIENETSNWTVAGFLDCLLCLRHLLPNSKALLFQREYCDRGKI